MGTFSIGITTCLRGFLRVTKGGFDPLPNDFFFEVYGCESKRCRAPWGLQVAVGSIFPFTNRFFWVPGIFDP